MKTTYTLSYNACDNKLTISCVYACGPQQTFVHVALWFVQECKSSLLIN